MKGLYCNRKMGYIHPGSIQKKTEVGNEAHKDCFNNGIGIGPRNP